MISIDLRSLAILKSQISFINVRTSSACGISSAALKRIQKCPFKLNNGFMSKAVSDILYIQLMQICKTLTIRNHPCYVNANGSSPQCTENKKDRKKKQMDQRKQLGQDLNFNEHRCIKYWIWISFINRKDGWVVNIAINARSVYWSA